MAIDRQFDRMNYSRFLNSYTYRLIIGVLDGFESGDQISLCHKYGTGLLAEPLVGQVTWLAMCCDIQVSSLPCLWD